MKKLPDLAVAWLIERHDLEGASIHYMTKTSFGIGWTPDPNQAFKFGTEADAQKDCNGGHVDGPLIVAEHGWHRPLKG